jgi:hypothetical protein
MILWWRPLQWIADRAAPAPESAVNARRFSAETPVTTMAAFMDHAKVTTTHTVYAHLLADDHSDGMNALGAMDAPQLFAANVIRLRR